jgi:ApbE superfamily uncharacterized protein (UPF0280 family)
VEEIFRNRTYRAAVESSDLVSFAVSCKETNLFIVSKSRWEKEARDAVLRARYAIEHYIGTKQEFSESLTPMDDDPLAPAIIRQMIGDTKLAGVGPMASVAGAIAEYVARAINGIDESGGDVIVENGGDIFMISERDRIVSIHAGEIPVRLGIVIHSAGEGVGISSSSARFGHSMSFGNCDLATVVARHGALSDACATALGNAISSPGDIEQSLSEITAIPDVLGALAICEGKIGITGDISLTAVDR